MTSRELTSGFDFWSRGRLRMAVMHLHIKVGADIFIQSGVIDIFPKLILLNSTLTLGDVLVGNHLFVIFCSFRCVMRR